MKRPRSKPTSTYSFTTILFHHHHNNYHYPPPPPPSSTTITTTLLHHLLTRNLINFLESRLQDHERLRGGLYYIPQVPAGPKRKPASQ